MRSPQAVHTHILRHVRGKRVVEIGTRRGDGVACWTHAAAAMTAVEHERAYCSKLEERAQSLRDAGSRPFRVMCGRVQDIVGEWVTNGTTVDADLFTWWM